MKGQTTPSKYFMLDANVLAGYYLPQSLGEVPRERARLLLECCRKGAHPDWVLLVPNIVIAEVFSVFAKYCFATWNSHVRKSLPGGLDQRRYRTIRNLFHDHIHNGKFLHQVELNRYHILGVDLVAPIDHHFQHYRGTTAKRPMQAADMLVLSIGICLNHAYGTDRFAIVTADRRMADICERARHGINANTADSLGLTDKARELGFGYDPQIYPRVVNLAGATKRLLVEVFGTWPPPQPCRCATGVTGP